MKAKFWIVFWFVISIVVLALSVISFTFMYSEAPNIVDTKLHVFTLKEVDGLNIYCEDGSVVFIDLNYSELFAGELFKQDIQPGEEFFARIDSKALSEHSGRYSAYALMATSGEYLSIEQIKTFCETQNMISATLLVVGCLIFVLCLATAIALICKYRKMN